MSLTVIKLGGSLMGSAELPAWLKAIESASKTSNIVIVPGGGEFANSIRSIQNIYQYTDRSAHNMALLSMCQFGYLLEEINPKLKVIKDLEDFKFNSSQQSPLLWLPLSIIGKHSEIEPNWDFTSDSIALWLATRLTAEKLILVKSKTFNGDRTNLINHINNSDIDKGFQLLMDDYSGEISILEKGEHDLLN